MITYFGLEITALTETEEKALLSELWEKFNKLVIREKEISEQMQVSNMMLFFDKLD